MARINLIKAIALLGFACGVSQDVFAQTAPAGTTPPAAEKKADEKVKTGVIASYGSFKNAAKVDAATTPSPGEEMSVISGSVSRTGAGRCRATVTNNSEESSYSVSFAVAAITAAGGTGASRSFTATVKPKTAVTRDVPCTGDQNLQVILRSARKL